MGIAGGGGMRHALVVGAFALVACASAWDMSMEITLAPVASAGGGQQQVEVSHETDSQASDDGYKFLSSMRKRMRKITKASSHLFGGESTGDPFKEVDRLFDKGDPFSRMTDIADSVHTSHRKRSHKSPHHSPMLDILRMVRSMARPLIQAPHPPLSIKSPRPLVAIICHTNKKDLCPNKKSLWHQWTRCLARHSDKLDPRCSSLLRASGVLPLKTKATRHQKDEVGENVQTHSRKRKRKEQKPDLDTGKELVKKARVKEEISQGK